MIKGIILNKEQFEKEVLEGIPFEELYPDIEGYNIYKIELRYSIIIQFLHSGVNPYISIADKSNGSLEKLKCQLSSIDFEYFYDDDQSNMDAWCDTDQLREVLRLVQEEE